jgi:small subunit ribosomal protein S20
LPNTTSAKKKVRQIKTRTARNNAIKSRMRYSIKIFNEALKTPDSENVQTTLVNAIKIIDKAASKGIIHKNTAARKKSSLYKKLSEYNISAG